MNLHFKLFDHQKEAVKQLETGSILCGGVGSGKSITSIYYYYQKEFPKNLYIITTAKKRDSLDWEKECARFSLSTDKDSSLYEVEVYVDSWHNIKKYINVKDSFFIFDEQRLIGSGVWVRSFLKIVKNNNWILLTATPGDVWMDYIPVFVANGFYKNRTEFIRLHVVFNRFLKFPKVDRYIDTNKLERLRKKITVVMTYRKPTIEKYHNVHTDYDRFSMELVTSKRWNPYTNKPIRNPADMVFTLRKIVNSDLSRFIALIEILNYHNKVIVFYNFNYELKILKERLGKYKDIIVKEYNGHKHDPIPEGLKWVYLVQYISGSEAWNCIETNCIVFYSLNYSWRTMKQAAGRIDRMNTPFRTLFYYRLISDSKIDHAIRRVLKNKKKFNARTFVHFTYPIIEKKNEFLKGE